METGTNQRTERPRLADALRLVDGWLVPQGPAGVGAAVWHRGQLAAERYAGDARPGVPVDERTIFPLASVTKPVTAAVVMTLIAEGLVALDEPVVPLVPEFRAAEGDDVDPALERHRRSITVRQLLAHTSGLPEDLAPRETRYADRLPLEAIVDAMCRLPLQSAPGAELRYSNAGYGVLGRLVERVTDQEFWATARRRVLQPMRLRDTVARPGPDLADRFAHLADAAPAGTDLDLYNGPYWRGLAAPWAGLYGTPRDLARFAGAFLPSAAAGPHLFTAPVVAVMTDDQANGVPGGIESGRVRWNVAHWGLGWEVKGTKRRHWTGELTSPATFCHFGTAGTLVWADPTLDLALAVFANRAVAHMWSFILARWQRLSNAVVAAATE